LKYLRVTDSKHINLVYNKVVIKKQKTKITIQAFTYLSSQMSDFERISTNREGPMHLHSLVEVAGSPTPTIFTPPPVQTFCSHNVVGDNCIMIVDGSECLGLDETRQRDLREKENCVLRWKSSALSK
jgi:hypothetical protein